MVRRHLRLEGHEFEQGPGVGDGRGGLARCSPRGRKSRARLSDRTGWRYESATDIHASLPVLNPAPNSPPHPTPPGWHRAAALGSPRHTADSPWLSLFRMALCIVLCYLLFLSLLMSL
ncbi:unnamed protein product [Rangifer tarandus platyrhynchus]|uniref:Uncharacterized protein n=1 Tax=Rangifer tarandus platyrhynchus TaxID=3082113 RepID=A0ACB1KHF2_RANTA